MFLRIKIFAGGDKFTKTAKIYPAKLSSYTVVYVRWLAHFIAKFGQKSRYNLFTGTHEQDSKTVNTMWKNSNIFDSMSLVLVH